MSFTVRRIDTSGEFARLAPVWSQVVANGGSASPFLSHDWYWCCWQVAGSERRPEVLVVEDAGSPVAALPLVRWHERRRGLAVRCLGFLTGPDTPVADLLTAGEPGPAVEAIVDHLTARSDWDVLHLDKIPSASPTLKALEAVLADRLPWERAGTLTSPYVDLAGGWTDFWASKSQRFKKTVRNTQNRIERAGCVSVEEHRSLGSDSRVFQEAIEVTRQSWKANRGLAIATMPGMLDFFTELTARASRHGWLALWLLRLDGRPLAMEYQLVAGGTVHALRADYDVASRDLSPGSALNYAIVRSLFGRPGVREYDMGPGANDYKLHWATGSHETVHLTVYRRSAYGRLLRTVDTVVLPAVRRIRERLS